MTRMALALALTLLACIPAGAQMATTVVANCGDTPGGAAYAAGQTRALVVDTLGRVCGVSSSTASNPVGATPTDRTIASTSGSSQTLMAANTARHGLIVQNTGTANCGINPTGGTAAIGAAGTLTLAPLGSYQPAIPSLSAITVICTAGQPVYAEEN